MVMTKKLLIIVTILLMLIISMFGAVCYADYDSTIFLYNVTNNNVLSTSISLDNQNSNINNLYSSGNRSIISRYSQQLVHVDLTFNDNCELLVVYAYNGSQADFNNYTNNINHDIIQTGRNSLPAYNLDYSNLNVSYYNVFYSGYVESYVYFEGTISYDMPLQNIQLIQQNGASALNFTSLSLPIGDTSFYINGNRVFSDKYYLNGTNSFGYTITYTLPYKLNNVDGFYLFNELTYYIADPAFYNNYSYDTTYQITFNGGSSTRSISGGPVNRQTILATLNDNSAVSQISYKTTKTSSWQYYQYNTTENMPIYLDITTFCPLFYNNDTQFIQGDTNGSLTPLHLEYYDAKWYELHYQLANAFIFLITELPIISNITNAVYSTINVIQTAFNTLSEFSAFGYIFAFGMFALVFGILIKLLLGD